MARKAPGQAVPGAWLHIAIRSGGEGELHAGVEHELYYFFVGQAHPVAGHGADVAYRILDALDNYAFAAVELAAVHLHLQAEQAGLDGGGYLGGTAGFGARRISCRS